MSLHIKLTIRHLEYLYISILKNQRTDNETKNIKTIYNYFDLKR